MSAPRHIKNLIAYRVAEFLSRYAPFDRIHSGALFAIAEQVTIHYYPRGEIIYNIGDSLHDQFYMIYRGAIGIEKLVDQDYEMADQFDEGDVFGIRPLFAHENYQYRSIAREESIVYGIPITLFREIAETNRAVGNYLMESFASTTANPFSKEHEIKFYSDEGHFSQTESIHDLQVIPFAKRVLKASALDTVTSIARAMSQAKVGSIIITSDEKPIGIITNKDLRDLIATGQAIDQLIARDIMSAPVLCYHPDTTIAQAQMAMMKHQVTHLVITEDGTPNTAVIGILSDNDIVVAQAGNSAALMKAIKRAHSTKELKKIRKKIMLLLESYVMNNMPLMEISQIMFELNDATIKRIIERVIEKIGRPPVPFAWMNLGSQGRKEQLLTTDQDNAIVFSDTEDFDLEKARQYFLTLAKKVNNRLQTVGFEYCEADMMAKNPRWCLSLHEWKQQFTQWVTEPSGDELLLSNIFFDFDIGYGDSNLTDMLWDHILDITHNHSLFMAKLAASSVRSPSPLGFFRQFLLEKDGKYKDHFDLKLRALMPLIDGGRLLALNHQIRYTTNTFHRFQRLAVLVPERAALFESCGYAFKALLKFRTKNGLQNHDSGRFIALESLTKEERMKLKRCFKTLSALQEYIKMQFNVKAIS